jgi:hypothetical protein
MENGRSGKPGIKDYFALSEVFGYFFRKPDPSRPKNFNIRAMHTINKISMLMFLIGTILFIFKVLVR